MYYLAEITDYDTLVIKDSENSEFCEVFNDTYEVWNKFGDIVLGVGFNKRRVVTKAELLLLKGVVTESLCYTIQLNSLCDIVLQGELMPHDYSYMYNRKGTLITVIFAAYKRRHLWYKYTYSITDLEKFQTLLTKIHIQYSEFFQ